MSKILHVLASGDIGGIEVLCRDIGKFSKHNSKFCFLWQGGVIEREMKESGQDTSIIGIKKSSVLSYLTAYQKLKKQIREENFSTIVFHHSAPYMWLILPYIKKQFPDKKVVLYAHNNYKNLVHEGHKSSIIRKELFENACKKADLIIAISYNVKTSIEKNVSIKTRKIAVVYNGTDVEKFYRKDFEKDIKRIIYVGRITQNKGLDILVKALALLQKGTYEAEIYGSGSFEQRVETLIHDFKLEKEIRLCGPTREVEKCMAEADIFVHPAIWEEGFGITLVEAMAAKLIVIAADVGAISEIIEDEKSGFLFEKGNIEDLAKKIKMALELDSIKVKSIRENAYIRALNFTVQKMVATLDQYFI